MKNFVKCGILLLMILLSVCVFTACECEHEFQETVIKEATCGQEGQKELVCAKCDEVQTEAIPATGDHRYIKKTTKMATCAAEGTKTKTCKVCNDVVTEVIPKTTNHSYSSKITKEATCTENGSKTKTCKVCNDVVTETILKTKHSYTEKVTLEATCEKEGVKTFTCLCGSSYTEKIAVTEQHSWKNATCTTPKTCSTCGKTEGTTSNHNYNKNGTCTKCKTSLPGATEYITFNDAFLEAYVKQSLGIQSTDKVSKYAMSQLTSIRINEGITDVQDLKYATNLQWISIDADNVKNLDVLCSLSKITYISLGYRNAIDISFMKNMKNLETVYYGADAIGGEAQDLLSSKKIKTLHLDMTFGLPYWHLSLLEGMQNLESLDIGGYSISTLFRKDADVLLTLPKLKELEINTWPGEEYDYYPEDAKKVFLQLMQKGVIVKFY